MPKGGSRPGSGRKPKEGGAKKLFACRLKPESVIWIEQEKERTGKSAGEIIDWAIEGIQSRSDEQIPLKNQSEAFPSETDAHKSDE